MTELPPLRRNRDFTLLWSGLTVSEVGSATTTVAVPLLVLALSGSAVVAGLVATIGAVAAAALRLPGGVLADRVDRRRLIVAAAAVRLVLTIVLAVAIGTGVATVWLVAVVIAAVSAAEAVSLPAEMAALPQLVRPEQLPAAYAGTEGRTYAAQLIGPSIGGVLYALGRAVPFWVDAVSYLAAGAAALMIRSDLRPRGGAEAESGIGADLREGLRFVRGDPFLRAVLAIAPLTNFAVTGAVFALTVVLRQAGVTPAVIGLANASFAVGGLLGAVAAPWLQARFALAPLVRLAIAVITAAVAVEAVLAGSVVMAVPLIAALLLSPALNGALFTRLSVQVPTHMQARVISIVILLAAGSASLAPLATGWLIGAMGGRFAVGVLAGLLALAACIALVARGIRAPLAAG